MISILNIFGSIKNVFMIIAGLFGVGYVAKLKYNAYSSEKKLGKIQNKIAKTNVIVAKKNAEAKAKSIKAETDTEIEVLKELKTKAEDTQKEMEDIHKKIEMASAKKKPVRNRTRSKAFTIEV